MSTNATFGFGIKIGYATTEGEEPTYLAKVFNLPFPTPEASDAQVTHLVSPDRFREYVKGWKEPGEVQLDLRFTEAQYDTLLSLGDDNLFWTISFPSGSTLTFEGYIKTVGGAKQLDDAVQQQLTIKVSGKPTFTLASASA